MGFKNKKKFIFFFVLIVVSSFSSVYAWELPEEVVVRNTYPPKKWKMERTGAENEGKYSIVRYWLYASTGRRENFFRNVIVWKQDDQFCVRVLRLNFTPDNFSADCSRAVNEDSVRKIVYKRLSSSGSLR